MDTTLLCRASARFVLIGAQIWAYTNFFRVYVQFI